MRSWTKERTAPRASRREPTGRRGSPAGPGPSAPVRAEIFRLHLERRKLPVESFDLPALAQASEGFSGAEIEQAIVSALYDAAGNGAPPDQAHLLAALAQTRPLSVLMREPVNALRDWARDRCVPAD